MQLDNVISKTHDKVTYVLCFYGKPTETEKLIGESLLDKLIAKIDDIPSFTGTRKKGYQQLGSAISNKKLMTGSSSIVKARLISTIHEEIDGVDTVMLDAEIEGFGSAKTFAFSREDLNILF